MPTNEFREAADIEAETPITVGATEPTLQEMCNRIMEALGDNRSCVEPCGECRGAKSFVYIDEEGQDIWTRCPACNGHGTTFRNDAVGRERIEAALLQWHDNRDGVDFHTIRRPMLNYLSEYEVNLENYSANCRMGLLWDNRHGQPWCDSLESHVRQYREDAPQWWKDWNGMGRLIEAALKKGVHVSVDSSQYSSNPLEWEVTARRWINGKLRTEKRVGFRLENVVQEQPPAVVKAVHAALCEGE